MGESTVRENIHYIEHGPTVIHGLFSIVFKRRKSNADNTEALSGVFKVLIAAGLALIFSLLDLIDKCLKLSPCNHKALCLCGFHFEISSLSFPDGNSSLQFFVISQAKERGNNIN